MTRFSRLEGVVDLGMMGQASVIVIGLGSGGSALALELAKAGVGRLVLCDPDVIEEGNVVRHECDDRYLGWSKPRAVADLALRRNPDLDIAVLEAPAEDAEHELRGVAGTADAVAVCTDTDGSRHLLNALCIETATPAVYAGVYARAVGGEVITCTAQGDAGCLACVESSLRDHRPQPDGPRVYGAEPAEMAAVAGLGTDVRVIALLAARAVIDLLGGTAPVVSEALLFALRPMDRLLPRPYASARVCVTSHESCLICGQRRSTDTGSLRDS